MSDIKQTNQAVSVTGLNLDELGLDEAAQARVGDALRTALEQELARRPSPDVLGYNVPPRPNEWKVMVTIGIDF